MPLWVKDHTCSLKIICLNFRNEIIILREPEVKLERPLPPLKKQQQPKHDHVHIAFCQVQRISLKVMQTVHVILASLHKYQLNLSMLRQDYYGKIIIYICGRNPVVLPLK